MTEHIYIRPTPSLLPPQLGKTAILACFLLAGLWGMAWGTPHELHILPSVQHIGRHAQVLADSSGGMGLAEALQADAFRPLGADIFSMPSSAVPLWFRFDLDNRSGDTLWLMLGDAFSGNELDFYAVDSAGRAVASLSVGSLRPASNKAFPGTQYYAPIRPGHYRYYLRSAAIMPRTFLFTVGTAHQAHEADDQYGFFAALFMGLLGGIIAYNGFLYLSSKDRIYLIYGVERLWMGVATVFNSSYPLWDAPWQWQYFLLWFPVTFWLQTLFATQYLQLGRLAPRLAAAMWVLSGILGGVAPVANLVWPDRIQLLANITQPLILLYYLLSIGAGLYVWRKGQRRARFYVLAWAFAIAGIACFMLGLNGLLPYSLPVANAVYLGFAIESVVFSMALGDRMNELKRGQEQAVADKMGLLEAQQATLERMVSERTDALQQANEELTASEEELRMSAEELMAVNERVIEEKQKAEEALLALQEAKNQMVQSEKLASIGQLTAGIAHEINNPVNFISGGTQALTGIIHDLTEMLNVYVALDNAQQAPENRQIIAQHIADVKRQLGQPDELAADALSMVADIKTGADRVAEIVRGLRNFSRSDADHKVPDSLHDILNNALLILNSKYKDRIDIQRLYDERIGPIECYSGQLSQVFMNIIGNAVDAIEGKGTVSIATQDLGEKVRIAIQDTGPGIPQEIQAKIFDPFFTTKDVGKGTGLGLSIVHGIVEKHGGRIWLESEIGKGTTFFIEVPK